MEIQKHPYEGMQKVVILFSWCNVRECLWRVYECVLWMTSGYADYLFPSSNCSFTFPPYNTCFSIVSHVKYLFLLFTGYRFTVFCLLTSVTLT